MTTEQAKRQRQQQAAKAMAINLGAGQAIGLGGRLGIGSAQSQSISPEVWDAAMEELAMRDREICRLEKRVTELSVYNGEKDERVRELVQREWDVNLSLDKLEDENARLRFEAAGQASEIEKLQRHLSNQAVTIKSQASTIARLTDTTDMPTAPLVRLVEPTLPVSGTDTQDSPVSVHTAPAVRWAGGK